jgi:hypothetical protein
VLEEMRLLTNYAMDSQYLLSGRDATAGGVLKSCRETCDG